MPTSVSAIVTNFNTGHYLTGCVESLLRQRTDDLPIEVIVVENASLTDQTPFLEQVRAMGARVLRLEQNLGHGGGCNRGLEVASGDCVLFVNSDVRACDGSIATLVRHLMTNDDAGIVEPRTFLDDDRAFRIPEIFPPTAVELSREALARVSRRAAEHLSRHRLRRYVAGWTATRPLAQANLTGAFLAARRSLLERLGGYDERYPLFYEDTDLFARVQQLGLELRLIPDAEVVHYGHRSVASIWDEAMAKCRIGRAIYLRRHQGAFTSRLDRCWERLIPLAQRVRPASPPTLGHDLGDLDEPLSLELEGAPGPFVLMLALEPGFVLGAGHLGDGSAVQMSRRTWESLLPGPYFVRAYDRTTWVARGRWHFRKR